MSPHRRQRPHKPAPLGPWSRFWTGLIVVPALAFTGAVLLRLFPAFHGIVPLQWAVFAAGIGVFPVLPELYGQIRRRRDAANAPDGVVPITISRATTGGWLAAAIVLVPAAVGLAWGWGRGLAGGRMLGAFAEVAGAFGLLLSLVLAAGMWWSLRNRRLRSPPPTASYATLPPFGVLLVLSIAAAALVVPLSFMPPAAGAARVVGGYAGFFAGAAAASCLGSLVMTTFERKHSIRLWRAPMYTGIRTFLRTPAVTGSDAEGAR